jgi:hypothetical protein
MERIRKLDPDSARQFDREMNVRRLELRMRWNEVAQLARMSVQNLSGIRKGKINLSEIAELSLEEALRWEPGSIEAIFAGKPPTRRPRRAEVDQLRDDTERDIWAVGVEGGLSEERIWWHIDNRRRRLAQDAAGQPPNQSSA